MEGGGGLGKKCVHILRRRPWQAILETSPTEDSSLFSFRSLVTSS